MTTDRGDRVIGAVAAGIPVAFAVSGALFATTASTRWFFAVSAVVVLLWPLARHVWVRRRRGDVSP